MKDDSQIDEIGKSIEVAESVLESLQSRINRIREFDELLSDRYARNMALFKDVMPHIYEEFSSYSPKNKNIFLSDSLHLNIVRSDVGKPLYADDIEAQAKRKVSHFLDSPSRTKLSIERNPGHTSRHVFYNNTMLDLEQELSKDEKNLVSAPTFLSSVVFFGLDLGYQLIELLSSVDVKHLYIYENNLDFFYYSLFAIEWDPILSYFNQDGKTLHFMLGVDGKGLTLKYLNQLAENGYFLSGVTYLYVSYSSPELNDAVEYFKKHYSTQTMGWGFFDDSVIGIAHGLRSVRKSKLACVQEEKKLPEWVKDIPVFILGNGPSLDHSIELIKSIRDRVLVVSCGSTINTLKKVGIKPDIHVDVERLKQTVDKFTFLDKDYLSGILGLSVDVMHPSFFDYFERTGIGMKPGEAITSLILDVVRQSGDSKKYVQLNHCGPLVANLALSYLYLFGFKNVYFAGVDNGYKDSSSHHSKYSGYYKDDGTESGFQYFTGIPTVQKEGNFGGVVHSTYMMDTSRVQLELLLEILNKRKGFSSFNLSDGAKIEGSYPVSPEDVMVFDPEFDRSLVIDLIYNNFFVTPNEALLKNKAEDLISISDFLKVVESLKHGWDDDFSQRSQVMHFLWENYRKIYFLKGSIHRHIYDMLIGSYTYFAFGIAKFIYDYEDENSLVKKAKEMLMVWFEFLDEMPDMVEKAESFVDDGNDHLLNFYNG